MMRLIGQRYSIKVLLFSTLLTGCATYTPQKIRYCADYYLYTEKSKLDAALHNHSKGAKENANGFYDPKDNSIHVMKWSFGTTGHEVFHGMRHKGHPRLIVEDKFSHFK